jgi:hypothetical protein
LHADTRLRRDFADEHGSLPDESEMDGRGIAFKAMRNPQTRLA